MKLQKLIQSLESQLLLWIVRAAMLAMVALVAINVAYRYFFGGSLTWTGVTLTDLIMPVVVFLGASMAFREGAFLSVTIVSDRFPHRIARFVDILFESIGAFVWGLIAWQALARSASTFGDFRIGVFAIPSWISYGVVGVGCTILVLQMIAHVWIRITDSRVSRTTDDITVLG